jgi:ribonuclease P protein component
MTTKAKNAPERLKRRSVLLRLEKRPKILRLKKRSDFLRLKDAGKKWVSPTVIVQMGTGESEGIRYGITATKTLGNAVVRNRVKRRLRAAANKVLADKTQKVDLVLIGRSETATCEFDRLVRDLTWCLKRLEVA